MGRLSRNQIKNEENPKRPKTVTVTPKSKSKQSKSSSNSTPRDQITSKRQYRKLLEFSNDNLRTSLRNSEKRCLKYKHKFQVAQKDLCDAKLTLTTCKDLLEKMVSNENIIYFQEQTIC